MAVLMSYFMTIKLICLIYLNFITAANEEEEMAKCMKTMAEYCKDTRGEPNTLQCFREAIDKWITDEIKEIEYLNEYYRTFAGKVSIANVPTPNDYCLGEDDTKGQKYRKCLDDLRVFGNGTTADAVRNAVYNLKKSYFVAENEAERSSTVSIKHYGFHYMAEIQLRVILLDEMPSPWKFCKQQCYPDSSRFPGWPHVTIMFYNSYHPSSSTS